MFQSLFSTGSKRKQEPAPPVRRIPGNTASGARDYPTEVFWGDTHLHTSSSMDADAARHFARGERVVSATQQP